MNRFVSSVMKSTNVSLNKSVQDGFPWKLLSVVAETPPIDYVLLSIRRSKSPRFERLREHFKNPMLEAYVLFYQFSLKVFVKLNLLLQREDSLISLGLEDHAENTFLFPRLWKIDKLILIVPNPNADDE